MPIELQNPKHWRDRAEEIRAKADDFAFADIEKQRLLSIAAGYERLAERAERWSTNQD